ncbi:hypothetical protein L226DRAFT_536658 [Lentinus tigrinus ALCF2SS1-7]|uniref:uncharacterized protein n=1 Tax=Lentinus tigrinus ALCF2SS1-7 TaxID=1328758 RepID=UPI0011663FC1|nr:hypothetical protein L226DRAFT_536658 [Lentinus tigrinus ALCF2SS1-7]
MPAWGSLVGMQLHGLACSHTVLRTGMRVNAASVQSDHGMVCNGCTQPIIGVWY